MYPPNSSSYNITSKGLTSLNTFGDFFGTIVLIGVATGIITMIISGLGRQVNTM